MTFCFQKKIKIKNFSSTFFISIGTRFLWARFLEIFWVICWYPRYFKYRSMEPKSLISILKYYRCIKRDNCWTSISYL